MIRIQKFLHAKYLNMSKNFFKEKKSTVELFYITQPYFEKNLNTVSA